MVKYNKMPSAASRRNSLRAGEAILVTLFPVPFPVPLDEEERLASLLNYALLDTPPEDGFDRLTRLAARLLNAPLALVTLLDHERMWIKSLGGPFPCTLTEIRREDSFCTHTILSPEVMVVEDAWNDPRFAENPLVTGEMGVRFYAGAALFDRDGRALGALCVIDTCPHTLTAEQRALLRDLADSVQTEMELRQARATEAAERRQAQQIYRRSEERLRLHIQQTPMAVIEWNLDFQVTSWNPAAERIFGYTFEDAVGHSGLELIVAPSAYPHVEQVRADLLAGRGGRRSTNTNITKDGREILCEWYNTPLVDEQGQVIGVAALAQDVTERRTGEAERRALEAERESLLTETETLLAEALKRADRDALTGLFNHRAFHKWLDAGVDTALRSGQPLAVLILDLNNFRFFNDAHGHGAGDDVLRRTAAALSSALSAACPEALIARFGGDEFAVLLPGADEAQATALIATLEAAADSLHYLPPGYETPLPLSFSVGRASLPEDGISRIALLVAADGRLRVAKSGGDLEGQAESLRRSMARSVGGFSMLDALVTAVDNKDRYTRRHSEDVLSYSLQIARTLGLSASAQHDIEVAALLHDVGKIGVPDHILRKPGRLTEEEFEAVMQHPMMGAVIVGAVPGFEKTLDAIRHHHERWDGGGYPFGLCGEEIPFTARLLAVADAYSAMTTDRPYRKGMDREKARRILADGAGTQWDPVCVAAFLRAAG